MALDAGQFKSILEKLPEAKDLMEFHVHAVESEKQRGIEESRKANSEAQNLRKYKIGMEKLGFNKEADELDKFLESIQVTAKKAGEVDTAKMTLDQVTSELNKLKTDYTKTIAELNAEKKNAETIKAQAARKTIKAQLIEKLNDKVYGHDFVAETLINDGRVILGENDAVQFVEGDAKVSIDDGIKKLLETRTDIVKNQQRPGANSKAPAAKPAAKYSKEQIESMSPEDIRANLADVKASLGITT